MTLTFLIAVVTFSNCKAQVITLDEDGVVLIKSESKRNGLKQLGYTSQLIDHISYKSISSKYSNLKKILRSSKQGEHYQIGYKEYFYVRNVLTGTTWDKIEATLGYKENGVNLWFQTSAYDTLTQSKAMSDILNGFEKLLFKATGENSVKPNNGVMEILQDFVGEFPNVDGDGILDVLLVDIQDNFVETGSFVAGFFDPINLYDHEFSNKRDLIYLDIYPTLIHEGDLNVERAVSTFAHESQHLIHAGYEGEDVESVFVNEGYSEAVEILCGFEPRSPSAFQESPIRGLLEWDHKNPLSDYSRASLWMHYLIEQLGTKNLKYFVQNPRTGINGYQEVIESISAFTFEEIFQNWGLALLLNNIELDSRFGYRHSQRNKLLLNPQTEFHRLPAVAKDSLPYFINLPIQFPLTKELDLNIGTPSANQVRLSSVSKYPGSDQIHIINSNRAFVSARADKSEYGEIEVLITKLGPQYDSRSQISLLGDGLKSGTVITQDFGLETPQAFYRNASYLMLNGVSEKIGVLVPPSESSYWFRDFSIWTLFKSEIEGTGIQSDNERDFEVSIHTYFDGEPREEIVQNFVMASEREHGKLIRESFDLSGFYEQLSAIKDTLVIVFGNDADDENHVALGMSQGGGNVSLYKNHEEDWVSLSEKSIGGNSLENWNPTLQVSAIQKETLRQTITSINEIKYDFEGVRLTMTPPTEYDSSSVKVVAQLPNGSFQKGDFISGREGKFIFQFPIMVDGKYKFISSYSSSDGARNYRDEKEWSIDIPNGFELSNNYPNPFNPVTTIPFILLEEAEISWEIFDITGRVIQKIPAKVYRKGEHHQKFNLDGYASGVYIARAALERDRTKATTFKIQKIMLIK
ncbi:MAG: T9SS type A sorting domain-containing protein [Gracilimonas sp.]|nr:T9SS type A sorting domain-containing protein [Gracilimonas sp.]